MIISKKRADNCELDDGHGGSVGLDNHIRYVYEEGGTPDGDCAQLDDFEDANHFFNTWPSKHYYYADYWAGEEISPEVIQNHY